ncbi:MAG: dihydropteroate synthase [Clostridia bacterium]|nr:dihydropteroate synthase [Clostridia bacterium]
MNSKRHYNFEIGGKRFESGTHIMGILNATPDSFFAASRLQDDAVKRAGDMLKAGAEVLDVGGQSTRPGSKPVSALEELGRVLPVVEAIRAEYGDALISVDTFYPEVAQAVIEAGANLINDVSCLEYPDLARVIAEGGASVCVMHNRRNTNIADMFLDKEIGLSAAVKKLLSAGVPKEKILLDGGIGFNKSKDEDWALLEGYDKLIDYFDEYPLLLGTSRKSMFGGEPETRLSATLDSTALAVKQGVLFVRVHDVKENKAVIDALR